MNRLWNDWDTVNMQNHWFFNCISAKDISLSQKSFTHFFAAICTPECQNAGTCSSPGQCTCTSEWKGNRCQIRKPLLEIKTKIIIKEKLIHFLKISYEQELYIVFQTHLCFAAICTPDCQNGGTCSSPGQCTCTSEWQGNRCQIRKILLKTRAKLLLLIRG